MSRKPNDDTNDVNLLVGTDFGASGNGDEVPEVQKILRKILNL